MPSSGFDTALLPPARILYQSDFAMIGSWRCPVTSPWFHNSGPAKNHVIVFPRTAVRIRHARHDEIFADPTVATLYNRGDDYERVAVSKRGDECEWFAVAPEVLVEAVHASGTAFPDERRPFGVTHTSVSNDVYVTQRKLVIRVTGMNRPEPLEVDETVFGILDGLVSTLAEPPAPKTPGERHVRLADRVRELVAQHFTEQLRLMHLAAECQVSPWFLAKVFRRVTGLTVHAYQDRLRLHRALELIVDSSDLASVALDLGYSSHSHFTASFRRTFGTTPADFRAEARAASRSIGLAGQGWDVD